MKSLSTMLVRALLVGMVAAAALMGGSMRASAQSSATANATASIVPAITISKVSDLQFGLIVAGSGGTVTVGTDSSRTVSGPAGLTNASYPVSAASFTVTGGANLTYTVSLPTSTTLTGPSSATMTVNSFTSNPSGTGTIGAGGTSTLNVGAAMTVGSSQTAGSYTGSFSVTVNYQ